MSRGPRRRTASPPGRGRLAVLDGVERGLEFLVAGGQRVGAELAVARHPAVRRVMIRYHSPNGGRFGRGRGPVPPDTHRMTPKRPGEPAYRLATVYLISYLHAGYGDCTEHYRSNGSSDDHRGGIRGSCSGSDDGIDTGPPPVDPIGFDHSTDAHASNGRPGPGAVPVVSPAVLRRPRPVTVPGRVARTVTSPRRSTRAAPEVRFRRPSIRPIPRNTPVGLHCRRYTNSIISGAMRRKLSPAL